MSTVNGFQVGSETLKYNYESLDNYNTPNFSTSSSKTYTVGDYVMYNGKLYKCTTATTGGTWVSSSWTLAVLSDDVDDLTRQLSDVESAVEIKIQNDIQWGKYNPYNDGTIWDRASAARLTSMDFVPLCNVRITGAMSFIWMAYSDATDFAFVSSQTSTWIKELTINDILAVNQNIRYIRIILKRDDNTDVDFTDIDTYGVHVSTNITNIYTDNYGYKYLNLTPLHFEQGGFNNSGINTGNYIDMRTPIYIPVTPGTMITVNVDATVDINIALNYYNTNDFVTARIGATDWYYKTRRISVTIPSGVLYCRVIIRKSSGNMASGNVRGGKLTYENSLNNSYIENGTFIKSPLNVLPTNNSVDYVQSFCVYNGKYYSTDGEHLGRQSADFSTESSVNISAGHGNSLQLGTNGKAYASGWNDNTIYIVDLETMAVTGTILLPTTGYTTGVVDDVAKVVYIFQRDTYPDTVESYNFIAYDYVNDKILHTAKTVPFSAQQACDLVDNTIICCAGLGTDENPNKFMLFDTTGVLIAQMKIPYFDGIEPEGIFVNRDDHSNIIISDISKNLTLAHIG